ncbi:DinB family protein [Ornithinimicrobium sp. INDO-MA30-4]|uniref:DinB family protein n=1 Tax=Ornithinimicrobium sp. INDO-MA30-4 TaxID=2908651 RepID=UPI001F2B8E9A|nr:DinB family protein [Ornithinimicrobium sp. INDO-MA30-4]UJH69855.1 DinB family protein [Ornithinimicrobium sp. INDO-MA30-4]
MTATGTNLIGLVKHMAGIEGEYFLGCFDRPFDDRPDWMKEEGEVNEDMWAAPGETTEEIVDLYRKVWSLVDDAIESMDLDTMGHVPWWDNGDVTLERLLVHVATETHRHAGHADIIREMIDGQTGVGSRAPTCRVRARSGGRPTARLWSERLERLSQQLLLADGS